MKIALLSATLLFSSFLLLSCKKDNPIPPGEQPRINITLEDASCTEAWIEVTTANISLPADVALFKDDIPVGTISLTSADTLIYIDSLLPNHTYKYQSVIQSISPPAGEAGQSSNLLTVTTMDTTSHNFTWQSWTFGGQAGSCTLYDVDIINENDIWAVGEIYLLDTLGQPDPKPYNLARWNGFTWELDQIPFEYNGSNSYGPIYSIYAFSSSDIWLGIGSMIHWDGIKFNSIKVPDIIFPSRINKIWGTSSNDLYIVGNRGTIAHYQNGQWSRIESGTELNINDIYGAYNDRTNKWEIIAPASDVLQSLDRDLLSINGSTVLHLSTVPISGTLSSTWFIPNRIYLVGGDGIFKKTNFRDSLWKFKHQGVSIYYTYCIRGTSSNNIVLIGAYGEVLHFNGYDFKSYISHTQINGNYYSTDIKNNIIAVVGEGNSRAVVTLGKRNN
jgi:hypothetical protein